MKENKEMKTVTVDGSMTFGELEEGLRIADFQCSEEVIVKPLSAICKVDIERGGNVYMTELPKRKRGNKPLFKDDNSSLSLGRDGIYYYRFQLPKQMVEELPSRLVRQASAIAQKVIRELICNQQGL